MIGVTIYGRTPFYYGPHSRAHNEAVRNLAMDDKGRGSLVTKRAERQTRHTHTIAAPQSTMCAKNIIVDACVMHKHTVSMEKVVPLWQMWVAAGSHAQKTPRPVHLSECEHKQIRLQLVVFAFKDSLSLPFVLSSIYFTATIFTYIKCSMWPIHHKSQECFR